MHGHHHVKARRSSRRRIRRSAFPAGLPARSTRSATSIFSGRRAWHERHHRQGGAADHGQPSARCRGERWPTRCIAPPISTFVKETEDFTTQITDAAGVCGGGAAGFRRHLVSRHHLWPRDGHGRRITNPAISASPTILTAASWRRTCRTSTCGSRSSHDGRSHGLFRLRPHPQHRYGRRRSRQPVACPDGGASGGCAVPADEAVSARRELNEELRARDDAERAQAGPERVVICGPSSGRIEYRRAQDAGDDRRSSAPTRVMAGHGPMLLDYAEHQARDVLRGQSRTASISLPTMPMRIRLGAIPCRVALDAYASTGDAAVLDFTGSDPQLTSALNVPTGGDPHHTLAVGGCVLRACAR